MVTISYGKCEHHIETQHLQHLTFFSNIMHDNEDEQVNINFDKFNDIIPSEHIFCQMIEFIKLYIDSKINEHTLKLIIVDDIHIDIFNISIDKKAQI